MNNEQLIADFITYFQTLSEKDQFSLGAVFNKRTGGKLSPYDSPNPVAVSLIQVEQNGKIKLLAGRRGIEPKKGELGLIGGFINHHEDAVTAAIRETKEESGLSTSPDVYKLLTTKITPGNQILIFLENQIVYEPSILETLVINTEVTEFVLIDDPSLLCFPTHQEVAKEFLDKKNSLETTTQAKPKFK